MSDLRTAAQQALEALESDPVALNAINNACAVLRAALAQQAEPLNLSDPAVQKRLATQWGYVPAAQAEPVEPVHEHEDWCASVTQLLLCDPPRKAPCNCKHTAPPQRRPLTEEEIDGLVIQHAGYGRDNFYAVVRAVERAHGIKE